MLTSRAADSFFLHVDQKDTQPTVSAPLFELKGHKMHLLIDLSENVRVSLRCLTFAH